MIGNPPQSPIPDAQVALQKAGGSPDFERVRRAMFRQGESDRVPLFEMSIHNSIKAAILGRPMASITDEVDFWRVAGYDFVSVRAGVRSVVRGYHPRCRSGRKTQHGAGRSRGRLGRRGKGPHP